MIASGSAGGGGLAQGAGTAIADEQVVRGDVSGLQGSLLRIDDAGAATGLTKLDVDNLRLDGNTLSATNVNGDVLLAPNGSGVTSSSVIVATNQFQAKSGASVKITMSDGGINMAADCELRATNGAQPGGSGDTGQKRAAGATWLDTDCAGGLGSRLTGRVVEASIAGVDAPNLLAVTESGKLITNEGASAEAYNTLPLAPSGPVEPSFRFYCQNANGIRATANAGGTIRLGATASAAAGFVRSSTVGSYLLLEAINATEWVAASIVGTWSIDA